MVMRRRAGHSSTSANDEATRATCQHFRGRGAGAPMMRSERRTYGVGTTVATAAAMFAVWASIPVAGSVASPRMSS